MAEISYQAKIIKALTDAVFKIASPDKTNKGSLLANAFLWDTIQSYAKKQSDAAWADLEKAELYDPKDAGDTPGTFVLAKSTHFTLTLTQSNPVRRFSVDYLAKQLKAKYKIAEPISKQLCEEAKQPTKPTKSLNIIEVMPNNS